MSRGPPGRAALSRFASETAKAQLRPCRLPVAEEERRLAARMLRTEAATCRLLATTGTYTGIERLVFCGRALWSARSVIETPARAGSCGCGQRCSDRTGAGRAAMTAARD